MKPDDHEITRLLNSAGEGGGLNALMPLVYDRIKQLAHGQMHRHANQPTLSATALVNEAYLRLTDSEHGQWQDRQHFFAVAAVVMRRIIIDYARESRAQKRGGPERPIPLEWLGEDADAKLSVDASDELIELDRALNRLAEIDERAARVVECRVFGGYTFDEAAETLRVSTSTAKRDWQFGRAWLKRELSGNPTD